MKRLDKIVNMKNTCAAYGDFNGMHRGHLKIITELVAQAKKRGMKSVVISRPAKEEILTNEDEKAYFLERAGVDVLISCENEPDLLEQEIQTIGAKVLVVGENHKNLENVKVTANNAGIEVIICEPEKEDQQIITTAIVKKALIDCNFEKVTSLLGHPYIIIGKVVHGKALGRTVGMPTANLDTCETKLKPPSGVYATSIYVDEEHLKAMTNIGKRPSVDNFDYVTIEAFILDFDRDIYGRELVLEVQRFVRGVEKFNSLEEVQQQVQKDIQKVRDFLAA
ncbi:riboflavin kinase [Muricomes intestini]|uniref:riboflavin kinase n=1 Tax=Muricomes intestini TaxID=1796634 RepID=UPI002FDEFD6A